MDTMARSLAEVPGPPSLPRLGNMHQLDLKRLSRGLEAWADEYGPYYRIRLGTRDTLVVSDVDAIHTILRLRPDRYRRLNRALVSLHSVFSADGDGWRRLRRLASQAMSQKHMPEYFAVIARTTARLRDRWTAAGPTGKDINVFRDMMRYAADVTAGLNLGYDVNTVGGEVDPLQARLDELMPMLNRRAEVLVPYRRLFTPPADPNVDQARAELDASVGAVIRAARQRLAARGGPATTMMEAMLLPPEGVEPFTDEEIVGNVVTNILFGEGTTASTMAWLIYYVSENPLVQERMRAETGRALAPGSLPSFDTVGGLPYIEAVVSETLRLKPVAPMIFAEPIEDEIVGDVRVPAGTPVVVLNGYGAQRDRHFRDSATFDPQRWLTGASHPHNIRAFLPFGAGPRFCPGRNLAMVEAKMVAAMAVASFELSRGPEATPVGETFTSIVLPVDLTVRVTPIRPTGEGR